MEHSQLNEVIEVTRGMILEQGVRSIRMSDIAKAAKISKRTLYESFTDKEDLLYAAYKSHFDSVDNENNDIAKAAPNVLIAMILVTEQVKKSASLNWPVMTQLVKFHPNIHKRLLNENAEERFNEIKRTIELGIEQGLFLSHINIQLTIVMMHYIGYGFFDRHELIVLPEGIDYEDAFGEVLVNFLRGISTTKGVKMVDEYIENKNKNK